MFGNVPHHRPRTPLRQGRGLVSRSILPLSTTLWMTMWTRDRIRLCSSRWAWRTADWVVSSSGPQKSHRTQEPTYTLSSIKPGYAHIPQRSPQSPAVPRGYAALHGRRPFGYAATGRTQAFGSDGRPKLATTHAITSATGSAITPATGPHRSSQVFGKGSTGFRSTPRSPSKPDTRPYTPVRIPRQGPLQEPQDSAVLEQHPHKGHFKALQGHVPPIRPPVDPRAICARHAGSWTPRSGRCA